MCTTRRLVQSLLVISVLVTASSASAQTIGVFRWQFLPYCNIVSLTVTQNGSIFTLDGTDDQCGASGPAAVTGEAFITAGSQVGFGFTIVATPGGIPVHVDASIGLGTLSGTWRDSAGRQGTFVFTPGNGTGGSPRPLGGIGASAIDPTQVQLRIGGICAVGELMAGVNQNGSPVCRVVSDSGGDITAVTAGAGLAGGGTAGAVALQVLFGGTGSTPIAARADHTHENANHDTFIGAAALASLTTGQFNTAVGNLALGALTVGLENVAVGASALNSLLNVNNNTAVGTAALKFDQSGAANTALGWNALFAHNGGNGNVAVGASALRNYPTGAFNTAIGSDAMINLGTGNQNVALGYQAGSQLTTGVLNVYLANPGVATESNTIRLGTGGNHTRVFLAGTRGVQTGQADGAVVIIDSAGQLGTVNSSRRTKKDIADLGDVGFRVQGLRPVQFRYIKPFDDGSTPIQYGLIAEEVEAVLPELVAYGEDGLPETVKYHVLPTLLLAEIQRLERARAAEERQIAELRAMIESLQRELAAAPRR